AHGVFVDGFVERVEVLLIRTANQVELLLRGCPPTELEHQLHQLNRQRVGGFSGALLGGQLFRSAQRADCQRLGRNCLCRRGGGGGRGLRGLAAGRAQRG